MTQRLQIAGDILGIDQLDRLIVNKKGNYFSMREEGDIDYRCNPTLFFSYVKISYEL